MPASAVELLIAEIESSAKVEARVSMPGVRPLLSWTLMAETELANRIIGNPVLHVQNIPVRRGLSRRVMTTAQEPPVSYEEEHYQWEEGVWTGGRRFFTEGPLEKFLFLFTHEPTPEGTLVTLRFGFGGRGPDGEVVARSTRDAFKPLSKRLADALAAAPHREPPELLAPARHTSRVNRVQLGALARALSDSGEDEDIVKRLVRRIEDAHDHQIIDMAPLAAARAWHKEADTVIDTFIRAARIGLLEPRWSVACPSCLGAKAHTVDVADLARRVHCDDCNIEFDADPAQNLQLTFSPAPTVRRMEVSWACIAGPARTPHVKAQAYAPAGEAIRLVRAAPQYGKQFLLCPDTGSELRLGPEGGRFRVSAAGIVRDSDTGDGAVEVHNDTGARVRFRLEDRDVPADTLRATEVLNRPRFRELFGADQWEFLSCMERAWRESFGAAQAPAALTGAPYDLVVIGSGPGGEASASRAAQLGARVALVEASTVFGGPSGLSSKAMREAARKILAWAEATPKRGPERLRTLFEERFAHLRRYVSALQTQEVLRRLSRAGVHLFRGAGYLVSGERVEVARGEGEPPVGLSARRVILATGSLPLRPPHLPFDDRRVLDAGSLSALEHLPRSLCIAGTGVIACEVATLMAMLGVKVHVVTEGAKFLPFLDAEVAAAFKSRLIDNGISFHPQRLAGVEALPNGPVRVAVFDGPALKCDAFLYAMGQAPATLGLGCEAAGVNLDKRGRVMVDAQGLTSCPTVWAVGDIVGPPGLASTAAQQGKEVADRMFGTSDPRRVSAVFPTTLWTFPEVASIGMTEQAIRAEGRRFVVGRAYYRDAPRGILSGDLQGFVKLVADAECGTLLGVHILGESACELVHYGRALVEAEASLSDVAYAGFSAVTFHGLYQAAAEDALFPRAA